MQKSIKMTGFQTSGHALLKSRRAFHGSESHEEIVYLGWRIGEIKIVLGAKLVRIPRLLRAPCLIAEMGADICHNQLVETIS